MTPAKHRETRFDCWPEAPSSHLAKDAHAILCYAHEAASSFLHIFETSRTGAQGSSTDEEQDLLRAMLTFASAGLDSMAKQLIKDALPTVIDRHEGAQTQFQQFAEKRLVGVDRLDARFLTLVLTGGNPRATLINELVRDLTAGSLQSKEALLRAAAYFAIPPDALTDHLPRLAGVFKSRNQIVHEMDMDFNHATRNRHTRPKKEMVDGTNELFRVARNMLREVDQRLTNE